MARGGVCYELNDFEKAIADLDRFIRLESPRQAAPYLCRGLAWFAMQEYDKAIADYTAAIQRDPGGLIAHQSRAEAWYHKQEFDKVIADCTVALRLDPHDAEVLELRARAWCIKREFDKAIADCTTAIRIDPRSAAAFGLRAWAWSQKREYDKAIDDYSEAIRLDPKNPDAYANRATAWYQKGDKVKAMADDTKCIGLDPTYRLAQSDQGSMPPHVKDQRQDIDELLRTMPLEHANEPVSDEHVKSVACATPMASLPFGSLPAPVDRDGTPASVTADSTLESQRLIRETNPFIQALLKDTASQEQEERELSRQPRRRVRRGGRLRRRREVAGQGDRVGQGFLQAGNVRLAA